MPRKWYWVSSKFVFGIFWTTNSLQAIRWLFHRSSFRSQAIWVSPRPAAMAYYDDKFYADRMYNFPVGFFVVGKCVLPFWKKFIVFQFKILSVVFQTSQTRRLQWTLSVMRNFFFLDIHSEKKNLFPRHSFWNEIFFRDALRFFLGHSFWKKIFFSGLRAQLFNFGYSFWNNQIVFFLDIHFEMKFFFSGMRYFFFLDIHSEVKNFFPGCESFSFRTFILEWIFFFPGCETFSFWTFILK